MSLYKSNKSKAIIQDHYTMLLNRLSVPYQSKHITTSYGKTHVLIVGDKSKAPLVLLHGSCSNAAMWLGDIENLYKDYYIHAIDILGEPGRSDEVRLDFKKDQHSDWLHDVINHLKLRDIVLVGNSLGGCIALHYASRYPVHLDQLILLASSGIVNAKISFLFKSISAVMRGEKGMLQLNKHLLANDHVPEELVSTTNMILTHFKPMTGGLPVISEKQLQMLNLPVTFVVGEKDCTLDVDKAVLKLSQNVPYLTVDVIENKGHIIYDYLSNLL